MAALVDIETLKSRLEWTLTPEEEQLATGAIEDASELVRFYGLPWTDTNAPPIVKNIVMSAATRFLRNPDGYTQSRAGDESVSWSADAVSGYVSLAKSEIEILAQISGKGSLDSVELTAWGPSRFPGGRPGYVPVEGGGDPFPLFPSEDGPW